MSVQPPASDFTLSAATEFACLRSEFIDEFARLELAVGRCLLKLEIEFDPRKNCFDQLVEKLSKAKPSPKLSKKDAAELERLPQVCQPFQNLRASMVHGVMEIVRRDDAALALFRNAADVLNDEPVCYGLTLADIGNRIDALARVGQKVRTIVSPSAPPPPRQAEAADP